MFRPPRAHHQEHTRPKERRRLATPLLSLPRCSGSRRAKFLSFSGAVVIRIRNQAASQQSKSEDRRERVALSRLFPNPDTLDLIRRSSANRPLGDALTSALSVIILSSGGRDHGRAE